MYISIDIGATNTRLSASQSLDKINFIEKFIFPTNKNFKSALQVIVENIKKLSSSPKAIGIGVAGRVENNQLVASTNLPNWVKQNLVKKLEKEFDCPVYIANDAVAQAYGELYYGHKIKNFLYIVWGTGLGGSLVNNNNATKIERNYLREWEEKFGGKNIAKRFNKAAKDLNDKEWHILFLELKGCIEYLYKIFKTDYIIFSGGIVDKQKSKLVKFIKSTNGPKIIFSNLAEDIGLYGGLALIKERQKNTS